MITEAKRIRTRSGTSMMFATVDDLDGTVEVVVFEKAMAAAEGILRADEIVLVRGRVDHKDANKLCIVVQDVVRFDPSEAEIEKAKASMTEKAALEEPKWLRMRVDAARLEATVITELRDLFERYPGPDDFVLEMQTRTGLRCLRFGGDYRIAARNGALKSELRTLLGDAPVQAAPKPAPGAPGERHTWASADKHGFGTSTTRESEVWFTLRSAELTEIYYPDLSTPSFRDLEFAVTDGRRFLDFERDARSKVEPIPGSLAFRQTTWTRRWKLVKTWLTDPSRATVLADVRFTSQRPLKVYVIGDPAPGDDGNDDRGTGMVAYDDTAASAVRAYPSLRDETSGYAGSASDPREQLVADKRLERRYDASQPGNVVQGARTKLTGRRGGRHLTLAIGFGTGAGGADATARRSLRSGFGPAARTYLAGWSRYLRSLERPPASVRHHRRLYEQSVMVLEASEDKRNRGASIASPSMPWVWGTLTLSGEEFSGPYHLVWPRDFYHVATAQQAAGDEAAATRLMDYLWRVQKPDGSWWQNTKVDGTPFWTSLQMDEV